MNCTVQLFGVLAPCTSLSLLGLRVFNFTVFIMRGPPAEPQRISRPECKHTGLVAIPLWLQSITFTMTLRSCSVGMALWGHVISIFSLSNTVSSLTRLRKIIWSKPSEFPLIRTSQLSLFFYSCCTCRLSFFVSKHTLLGHKPKDMEPRWLQKRRDIWNATEGDSFLFVDHRHPLFFGLFVVQRFCWLSGSRQNEAQQKIK